MIYDALLSLLREKNIYMVRFERQQSIHSSKYFTPQNNSHTPGAQRTEKLAGPILRRAGSDD